MVEYVLGRCSYEDLIKEMKPDTIVNTKALVGWDLMLKGKRSESSEKFKEVTNHIETNGLKWYHGIFYLMAKAGYAHNQGAFNKEGEI